MRKASGLMTFIVGLALLVFTATSPAVANGGGNNDNPPGFNGMVKIHEDPGEPRPIQQTEPKVCMFHIHGLNFDKNSSGTWHIEAWPPGGDRKSTRLNSSHG